MRRWRLGGREDLLTANFKDGGDHDAAADAKSKKAKMEIDHRGEGDDVAMAGDGGAQ